ncbi:MAG: hypothetical protein AB7T27_07740 [Kiritimatiellia bacterium]
MKKRPSFGKFKIPQPAVLLPVIIVAGIVLMLQSQWTKKNQRLFKGIGGLERIACQYCRGTGAIMNEESGDQTEVIYCPVCYGVGFRFLRRLDKNDKICPACGGLGRLQDLESGHFRTCGRCDGRGLIRVETETAGESDGDSP